MSDRASDLTTTDGVGSSEMSVRSRHEKHCFIVMPFGRTLDEERWYRGWYQAVIEPAVTTSGFEAILSASEDHPAAINDEIRSHLVFDSMVVVDLGGMGPEDAPNPNVMYELGIRHAFGLPLVIMAWEGQRLPFDVSNQRAIMTRRDFMEIEPARQKLIRFIKAAQQGRYYNPMESVGREAAIENTSLLLSEDSLLGALTSEVRELRNVVNARQFRNASATNRGLKLRNALGKSKRTSLWPVAQEMGINTGLWSRFLATANHHPPRSSAIRHISSICVGCIICAAGSDSTQILGRNALLVFDAVAHTEWAGRDKYAEAPASAGAARTGVWVRIAVRAGNVALSARSARTNNRVVCSIDSRTAGPQCRLIEVTLANGKICLRDKHQNQARERSPDIRIAPS